MRRRDTMEAEAAGGPAAQPWPETVRGWNETARALPGMSARALAAMHTCMYNAWAAYDGDARQTVHGMALRLPRGQRDGASKADAMHHAARVLLAGLFPAQLAALERDDAADQFSPAGIGRTQALSMLDAWRADAAAGRATPFAPAPGVVAVASGTAAGTLPEHCWEQARLLCAANAYGDDQQVLLYFALGNALADAALLGGAVACGAAASEVLRRFGGAGCGATDAAGREIGGRVFDKARRYWQGKL